jgi:hypothetical protein
LRIKPRFVSGYTPPSAKNRLCANLFPFPPGQDGPHNVSDQTLPNWDLPDELECIPKHVTRLFAIRSAAGGFTVSSSGTANVT